MTPGFVVIALLCPPMKTSAIPFEAKINRLFADRLIDWQYAHSSLVEDKVFYRKLQWLQAAIYALDAYLEQTWILDQRQLDHYWEGIHQALADLGLTPFEQEELLSEVRQYQAQEMSTHTEALPVLAPIQSFYYFKTCDVRLHRRLIQRFDRNPEDAPPLAAWLPFDLITEVEDDLDDLEEDEGTYNVNRFLAALRTDSPEDTVLNYIAYIDDLLEGQVVPGAFPYADLLRQHTLMAAGRVSALLKGTSINLI
jgi:hypothetical protein